MARQQKVSINAFMPAVLVCAGNVKNGGVPADQLTAEVAEMVGLSIADCEARFKRFASNKVYKPIFDKVREKIGGEIHYQTSGAQGAPRMSEAQLDSWLNDAENL